MHVVYLGLHDLGHSFLMYCCDYNFNLGLIFECEHAIIIYNLMSIFHAGMGRLPIN